MDSGAARIVEANFSVPDFASPTEAREWYEQRWAELAAAEAALEDERVNGWRRR